MEESTGYKQVARNLKKHYDIEELNLKNDSEEEQIRTRKIFEDLREKAVNGKLLLEREKEFLCTCFKLTDYEDDGNSKDFDACSNFKFKQLYLTYFSSALGSAEFYKAHKGTIYVVPEKEKFRDFKYLNRERNRWLKEIEKTNHSDQILQQLASETRTELKNHKKKLGKLLFKRQKEKYAMQKDKYILHSKFIFLLVKQVFEDHERKDFEFEFLSHNIEIDSYSMIHIVNRHYAEIIKENPQKTYHIEDFEPDKLHIRLKDILKRIEKSGIIQPAEIEKLAFEYKNKIYRVWIKKRKKNVKGQGEIEFYRLETFYPIEDKGELEDLSNNYELIPVDVELKIHKKK